MAQTEKRLANQSVVRLKLKINGVLWSNFQAIPAARFAWPLSQHLETLKRALRTLSLNHPRRLAAQGIFWGEGNEAQKVAFLFPGQGSQYVGMMQSLAEKSVGVAEVFERGEEALKPLINGSLKDIVWGDREDPAIAGRLRQTEICQPAMLTADIAMMRWLNDAGLTPDWVAGHSLGEYAACVAAGVMDFEDALHAVSARGKEMAAVDVPDCGKMATVAAGVNVVEEHLRKIDGYVVAANQNCHAQTVIAGATDAVERAVAHFQENGIDSREIPVSHAFHSGDCCAGCTALEEGVGPAGTYALHTCLFAVMLVLWSTQRHRVKFPPYSQSRWHRRSSLFDRSRNFMSTGYVYLSRSVLAVRLQALFEISSTNVRTRRFIQITISVVILKVPLMLWPRFLLRGE